MQKYLDQIYNSITEKNAGFERKGDKILLTGSELTLKAEIENIKESDQGCMAILYFWLEHPSFEKAIFETSAAVGATVEEAVSNATASFYITFIPLTAEYLEGREDETFNTLFFGTHHHWAVTEGDIVNFRSAPHSYNTTYWPLIESMVKQRLGNKPFYYIKVFTARQQDGTITSECRINNIVSTEISGTLQEYVTKWDNEGYASQKQIFFISRKSPAPLYPYTQRQIEDFTLKAAHIYRECDTDEKYENIFDTFYRMTGDLTLASDLKNFLPEICAENYLDEVAFSETLNFSFNGNPDEHITVYKDQITSYYWIQDILLESFANGALDVEIYKTLIALSANYNVYLQASQAGSDLSSLRISTIMSVPAEYEIR